MAFITVDGVDQVREYFSNLPAKISDKLAESSQSLADSLTQLIESKLSGSALQSRSGKLKDSISNSIEQATGTIGGVVSVSDDVPYAAIQEYGGTTKAHVIEAINGKALAFQFQGKNVFFAQVNHPGSNIPAHSYMRSSLQEMQDEIISGLKQSLSDALV